MPDYTMEYVYANGSITWTSPSGPVSSANNSVPGGTTFTLSGSQLSASVTDDDPVLEDSVNAAPQTLDRSEQQLTDAMGANNAGDYVFSRGFYEVEDELGNVGRLYQIRVAPWDHQGGVPGTVTQYWAFSGDIVVDPDMTYTVRSATTGTIGLNPVGNADYDGFTQPRCFVAGTLIETAKGPVPVEDLRVGDLFRTRDHGLKPVMWIESQKLERVFWPKCRICARSAFAHRPWARVCRSAICWCRVNTGW